MFENRGKGECVPIRPFFVIPSAGAASNASQFFPATIMLTVFRAIPPFVLVGDVIPKAPFFSPLVRISALVRNLLGEDDGV